MKHYKKLYMAKKHMQYHFIKTDSTIEDGIVACDLLCRKELTYSAKRAYDNSQPVNLSLFCRLVEHIENKGDFSFSYVNSR